MLQEKLFKFLDESLKEFTIEEKVQICDDIKWNLIDRYQSKILEDKKYCYSCKKYSDKKDFKFVEETETIIDNYHSDEFEAEVLYLNRYCPLCNGKYHEKELKRIIIR